MSDKQLALLIALGALGVSTLLVLAGLYWRAVPYRDVARESPTQPAVPRPASGGVSVDQPVDIGLIRTAMTDCDDVAAREPDTLYFLVIPVAPKNAGSEKWASLGNDYGSFVLLPSKVALDGLGDQSLALNPRRYQFFMLDSASGSHHLGSGTGVTMIKRQHAPASSEFKLGFDRTGQPPQWSALYQRREGVCYWVNVGFKD